MRKNILFVFAAFLTFSLISCQKDDIGKDMKEYKSYIPECDVVGYSEYEDDEVYTRYEVEPLVIAESCNCIVSGMLKFVDIDSEETAAIIKFGEGDCDDIAYKTTYYRDGCSGEKSVVCKLQLDCEVVK